MGRHRKYLPFMALLALPFLAVAFTTIFTRPVKAAEKLCSIIEINTSPDTGGNIYRTLKVETIWDSNERTDGNTNHCFQTIDGTWLNLPDGRRANWVTWGPQTWDGHITPGFSYQRVGIAPDADQGVSVDTGPDGLYEVFQDDAAIVAFSGSMIYCNGFGGFGGSYCDAAHDIYRDGVEGGPSKGDGSPVRGAGYHDIAPVDLTGIVGTDASGGIRNIPVDMYVRNTWSGGQAVVTYLTLRFPPKTAVGNVQGRVYDANSGAPVPGVTVETCRGVQTTDGAGDVRFSAGSGERFCMRVIGVPSGYEPGSARMRPWGEGYLNCGAGSVCNDTYECQIVNENRGPEPGCSGNNNDYDRGSDIGYDFVISPLPPATILGRIWQDSNGNGSYDGGENFIQNGVNCAGGSYITLNVQVNVSGGGSAPPNQCNPDPYYQISTNAFGVRGISVLPPPGWVVTNGNPQFRDIQPGSVHHVWFGLVPAAGCTVNPPTVEIGGNVTFTGTGGIGGYSWSAPAGGMPTSSGSGNPFVITYATPGTRTITVTSGSQTANCPATWVTKPYFRVFGGDVTVGNGFKSGGGSTCTNTSSTLLAFNRGGSPDYGGAGTQLAAYALGVIDQFASAMTHSANPLPPTGLTFANDSGDPYGGKLSSGYLSCATDYYAAHNGTDPGPGKINVNPGLGSATYDHVGDVVINSLPADIKQGDHVTIYVKGNAFITGLGVRYRTPWAGVSDIPSFTLVVQGNIYIEPSVTQVDGVLIAQDDGSGTKGRVYTCGFNDATPVPDDAELNGSCQSNNLTINGAVVAKMIKFLRTKGTLRDSPGVLEDRNSLNVAERIVFSPAVWLASRGVLTGKADSYTALPPIL
jgi:hypothetical protein